MPRVSFDETQHERFPFPVSYAFDPNLLQATLTIEGCDLPYTIPSGEIIKETFLEESYDRFAGVTTLPTSGQGTPALQTNSLTIRITLVNQSFVPINRTGEEDRYIAMVNLQLLAVYVDAQGHELAQTPLQYSTRASMWTPALSSNSTSCATGQFDGEIQKGAAQLVEDMLTVIPQLLGKVTPQPQLAQQGRGTSSPLPQSRSSLTFRSMLEDANKNLVLEGGEMVVLKVETTNAGSAALQKVEISLSGSPELVAAFTSSTDFPLNIGQLQAGESRITEIRGKVPWITEKKRGELVISALESPGKAPRTHRILVSMQPGQNSLDPKTSRVPAVPTVPPKKIKSSGSSYYAILVGLNTYRDPWPGTQSPFIGQVQPLADALEVTGIFTGDHVKKLQGLQATKAALEEAIFSWGRQRITKDTVLLFYFYGQALAHTSTGEVYLLPYDSSPNGSSKSLIPLQTLQTALSRLNAKATLLFLDTPLIQAQGGTTHRPVNWAGAIPNLSKSGNSSLIQIRHQSPSQKGDSARMLIGLFGRADRNSDHSITIGEILEDLKGTAKLTPSTRLLPIRADIPLTQ
ncbi:MAG: hypothetical protein VST68_12565 [Nitrospirota bacterium]|nr:hypothetical protein [Nitrospirota bacterium]